MNCPKCNKPGMLSEAVGDGKVRKKCNECGFTETVDNEGRKLLTDEMPPADQRQYLTEG